MSKKMMVDGKPVDFNSLFEDESPEEISTESSPDISMSAGENVDSKSAPLNPDEWWKELKSETFARKNVRPGDLIEVVVITVGGDNILFAGQTDNASGHNYGRIEGVISCDDFSAQEISELKPGTPLKIYVVSAARKGEVLSVEGSREARAVKGAGGGADALRDAQASGIPVSGKVTGENKGGYEVALQGAKGFVPFSQMDSGPRLPADQYIGQTFQFRVTRVEGRNVVLSRAALQREEQEAGREAVLGSLEVGRVVSAVIRKIESFGLFVDLGSGLSALVPQSEAGWSRGQALHSRFTLGETVTVKILKMETFPPQSGKLRISASIKQADTDPWDNIPDGIAPGRQVQGTVTRMAEFGAFVELAPGLDALLHVSEMSGKRRVNRPAEVVQAGQQILVRVIAVDRIKKRISVSLKDEADQTVKVASQPRDPEEFVPSTISIPAKGNSGSVLAAAFFKAGKK